MNILNNNQATTYNLSNKLTHAVINYAVNSSMTLDGPIFGDSSTSEKLYNNKLFLIKSNQIIANHAKKFYDEFLKNVSIILNKK